MENPVAVLDQDEAKKFLMGKAEDKYAFFMKATELERVDRSYASILEKVGELEDSNLSVRATLKISHDVMLEHKKKWDEHIEIGKLKLKLRKLYTDYAWAFFNEVDEEYSTSLVVC